MTGPEWDAECVRLRDELSRAVARINALEDELRRRDADRIVTRLEIRAEEDADRG